MGFGSWDMDALEKHLADKDTKMEVFGEEKKKEKEKEPLLKEHHPSMRPLPAPLVPATYHLILDVDIPIAPYGKARPRLSGKRVHMPAKYVQWKDFVVGITGRLETEEALHMEVTAYRKFLSKWSKKKCREMEGRLCTSTPDLDNLLGSIMDVVLKDDSMVASDNSRKVWGPEGRLLITFYEVRYDK